MAIEFELKYRATPVLLARMRQQLPGQEQVLRMHTTYYDTPTGFLSARHCTLRCRRENDSWVCTFKAPADGFGRREWEVPCDCVEDSLDMLCKLGAPEALLAPAREGLVALCGARFTRIAKQICLDSCTLEVALDEGVLTGGDRELPLCEAEIELKQGDPAACVAYGKSLEAAYGLTLEKKSKFCRALELYRGEG